MAKCWHKTLHLKYLGVFYNPSLASLAIDADEVHICHELICLQARVQVLQGQQEVNVRALVVNMVHP